MAALARTLITKPVFSSIFSRSFVSNPLSIAHRSSSSLLRPLIALAEDFGNIPSSTSVGGVRCFAVMYPFSFAKLPTTFTACSTRGLCSHRDCNWEHWRVDMKVPEDMKDMDRRYNGGAIKFQAPSQGVDRDKIIDYYLNTLALVLGSKDEARKKMHSVSTRYFFNFVCKVSNEIAAQIWDLPGVEGIEPLPNYMLNMPGFSFTGEPFINGQAVPYDPIYHEGILAYLNTPLMSARPWIEGTEARPRVWRDDGNRPRDCNVPNTEPNMGSTPPTQNEPC